jgi:hypothetical protein
LGMTFLRSDILGQLCAMSAHSIRTILNSVRQQLPVSSIDRRNTLVKSLCWCFIV